MMTLEHAPAAPAAPQDAMQMPGGQASQQLRQSRREAAMRIMQGESPEATPASKATPAPSEAAPEATETEKEPADTVPEVLRAQPAEDDGEEEAEQRLSAVVRQREAAQRARREAQEARQLIERERMRLDMERREVEQLRRAREAMAKDPLAGLRELGVDVRDLTERAALEGTPEAQMRVLQEQLAAQKRELDEYRQTQQAREVQAQRQTAEAQFFSLAKQEEQFPFLAARAELHPELVKAQAYQLQDEYYRRTGKAPTLQDLAEALDYIASEEYRHVSERNARRGTSSAADGTPTAAVKAKPSRTLSAARAGERTVTKPDTRNMTRDQRRRYVVQLLESGRLDQDG